MAEVDIVLEFYVHCKKNKKNPAESLLKYPDILCFGGGGWVGGGWGGPSYP